MNMNINYVLEVCITSMYTIVNIVILIILIYWFNSKVLRNDVDELCLQ